jgi:hypothetical protein
LTISGDGTDTPRDAHWSVAKRDEAAGKTRRHDVGRKGAPSISEGSMSADRISVAIDHFLRHCEKELAHDAQFRSFSRRADSVQRKFLLSPIHSLLFHSTVRQLVKNFLALLPADDRGSFLSLFYYFDLVDLIYDVVEVRNLHQHANKFLRRKIIISRDKRSHAK